MFAELCFSSPPSLLSLCMARTALAYRRMGSVITKAFWAGRGAFNRQTSTTTRWAIVIMWARGYAVRRISGFLECSRPTVDRWINVFRVTGVFSFRS